MELLALYVASLLLTAVLEPLAPVQLIFPFLAICALRKPYKRALWIAALSGLCFDMCTQEAPLGMHALIFSISMFLLFRYHRLFFEEKGITFIFYAFLFSFVSAVLLALRKMLGGHMGAMSSSFFVTDFLLLPFLDALSGYIFLIAPKFLLRFFTNALLEWKKRGS